MMDRLFLMLFSRTIGQGLVGRPVDFFGLGRVIGVPSPSVSTGRWCSNDELMILTSGRETIFCECLKSSLLMSSGPAARPFWSVVMAVLTYSSVIWVWRGRWVLSNSWRDSSCWSVNCCWNQFLMALALPLSAPIRLPSDVMDNDGRGVFRWAELHGTSYDSHRLIWSVRASASSTATSFNLICLYELVWLRSIGLMTTPRPRCETSFCSTSTSLCPNWSVRSHLSLVIISHMAEYLL